MKIKKGDNVLIISGKYKGVKSTVERALPKDNKIVVKDVNLVTKHVKKQGDQGGRIKFEKPISVSIATLICTKCEKPSRIGYKIENNKKVRFCKKCKEII